MKRRKRVLTPGRERLAKAMAKTNSVKAAALEAGMAVTSAYDALRSPDVQAVVWREQMYRLRVIGVPAAVKALIDVATSPTARDSARVMAADKIMQHAKEVSGGDGKPIDQMTADEMQAQLDEIRSRRAELATVVDAEVIEPGALD